MDTAKLNDKNWFILAFLSYTNLPLLLFINQSATQISMHQETNPKVNGSFRPMMNLPLKYMPGTFGWGEVGRWNGNRIGHEWPLFQPFGWGESHCHSNSRGGWECPNPSETKSLLSSSIQISFRLLFQTILFPILIPVANQKCPQSLISLSLQSANTISTTPSSTVTSPDVE